MKQTLTQDTERQPNQRTPSQLQHTSTARASFEDRRESTTRLRQMQAAMDHSPQAIAQRQRSAQFHNSPRMVAQRQQMAGQQVNVDQRLEAEADVMGERAVAGGVVQARGELGGSIDLTGALSHDYVRRTSRLGSTQTAQLASWQPEETEPDATHYWDEQMDGVCWYSNGEVVWFHVVKQGSEDYSALDGVKKTWQEWHDLRQKSHPEEYPDLVPSTHGKQSEAIEEVVAETTDHEGNILEGWTKIAQTVGGPEGYEFTGNVRKTNFVMGPHKQSPAFALTTRDKFMAKFNKAEIGDILINHEHLTTLNGLLLMAKRGLMAHEAGHVKFNSANHPRALYEHEHVSAVGSLENTTELKKYLSMKTGGITNYELVMKQCSDEEYKEFIRMKYD